MPGTAHILCVAHSVTNHDNHLNPTDAFVNTALYMCELLKRNGYRVYMYAVEGSGCPFADEVVPVVGKETYRRVYESRDNSMVNTFSDTSAETWQEHNRVTGPEVLRRSGNTCDLVMPMFGCAHKPCTDFLVSRGMKAIIEPCVGHPGSYAPFRVYCSYAWMYADMVSKGMNQGHNYWSVIPHFLPVRQFPFRVEKDSYAVYLGRIQQDKGVTLAIDACRRAGITLKVAGNGRIEHLTGKVPDHVEYLGVLDMLGKTELLSRACCLFAPTQYWEPFSYACLEAQMCGTPVLCSRWGGPSEIVIHGVTGYHCDTLQTYVDGISRCGDLSPRDIRMSAMARFSVEAVSREFQEYFDKVRAYCAGEEDFYTVGSAKPPGWGMGRLCSGSSCSSSLAMT